MKVKEFLPSLMKMVRLKMLDPKKLNEATAGDLPVIVTCTSIPSRFHVLDITVRSVLNQTTPPKKMVVWLHQRHQNSLPKSLTNMIGDKFEIRFTELDSPHAKLVPALKAFPDEILVTCDDDLMYERGWLEALYQSHLEFPNDVIAHVARNITYQQNGQVYPYKDWEFEKRAGTTNPQLLPLGSGGVLYPPGCLHNMATDSSLYLKLSPKADDLWFKAMSILADTRSRTTRNQLTSPYPIINSQAVSLKKSNVNQDRNRIQWMTLVERFDLHPQHTEKDGEIQNIHQT
jgi:hypothetical protein